jgi:hypothetical protein
VGAADRAPLPHDREQDPRVGAFGATFTRRTVESPAPAIATAGPPIGAGTGAARRVSRETAVGPSAVFHVKQGRWRVPCFT